MGDACGLYLLDESSTDVVAWRLDKPVPPWVRPNTQLYAVLRHTVWGARFEEHRETVGVQQQPTTFMGGRFGFPTELLLHDSGMHVADTRVIASPIVSISSYDGILKGTNFFPPHFAKLVHGHEVIERELLSNRVRSGAWIRCTCPLQVVFGQNAAALVSIALRYRDTATEESGDAMVQAGQLFSGLFDYAKIIRICEFRFAFATYLKRTRRLAPKQIERYLDTILQLDQFNKEELTEILQSIDLSLQAARAQFARIGGRLDWNIVQESLALGKELELAGIDRYVYDFFIPWQIYKRQPPLDDGVAEKARMKLEGEFDQLADAIKGPAEGG